MTDLVRAVSRNPFTTGLFGGLAIGIPLMILGLGGIGTAVLMVGIFGGLLAGSLIPDDEDESGAAGTDESAHTDDELADLQERYVEGDLSEAEFERRVEGHLVDDDTPGGPESTDRSLETETATDP